MKPFLCQFNEAENEVAAEPETAKMRQSIKVLTVVLAPAASLVMSWQCLSGRN
jgi:hypothetical protein